MTKFSEISSDIPLPPRARRAGPVSAIAKEMNVGDSILIKETSHSRALSSFNSCARTAKLPYKFTSRKVIENGVKGIRVWRIV